MPQAEVLATESFESGGDAWLSFAMFLNISYYKMLCPLCIIPSLIFLFLVVFLNITLIVTYSKAL